MLKLMNPHIKDYQGVEELQRICRKKIHYDPFGSLYILKKPEEVKDFLEKKKGGKRFVKGVQSIMITTAALIVVGFAMYKYGQSSEEIRRREGEKELLAQVLSSNEK